MTSDLSSALEVCFKRDVIKKLMFTLLFTLLYFTLLRQTACQLSQSVSGCLPTEAQETASILEMPTLLSLSLSLEEELPSSYH